MKLKHIPFILLPFLVSCGKDEVAKETKPAEPTIEDLVKVEIEEHLQKVTMNHMEVIPDYCKLAGPIVEIEVNEAAKLAKVDMLWTWMAVEDLYYGNSSAVIETKDGTTSVLRLSKKAGEKGETFKETATFSIVEGKPVFKYLADALVQTRADVAASKVKPIAFYDDYVIEGTAEHKKLKQAEELIIAERDAKAKAERDATAKLKAEDTKKQAGKLLVSLQKAGEFTGFVRVTTANDEWRVRIRNVDIQEKAGDTVVEFNIVNIREGNPRSTQALYSGKFDPSGNLACKCIASSNSGGDPDFILRDGGSIVLSATDHIDKLRLTATHKKYSYKGEMIRD